MGALVLTPVTKAALILGVVAAIAWGGWLARGRWDAGEIQRLEGLIKVQGIQAQHQAQVLTTSKAAEEAARDALKEQSAAILAIQAEAERRMAAARTAAAAARAEAARLQAELLATPLPPPNQCEALVREAARRELLLDRRPP